MVEKDSDANRKQSLGKDGEDYACDILERKGYKIIERNFRLQVGEIDIIAKELNGTVVFVEVKTVGKFSFGGLKPEDNMSVAKMKKFSLEALYRIIEKRITSKNKDSYSYKLFRNPKLLNKKILEEARELTKTKNKKQAIWEASDLLYFMLVFLVKRNIEINDILGKLKQRNKKLIKAQKYKLSVKKRLGEGKCQLKQ